MSDAQHEAFLARLDASPAAVFRVAQWLHAAGRTVEIPALRKAPTRDVASHYTDHGDLFILARKPVEVKQLSIAFTSADDWPYPEVFVDNAARARHRDDVAGYVSVNAAGTHMAIITRETQSHWYEVTKRNGKTGFITSYMACPLHFVRFGVLPP